VARASALDAVQAQFAQAAAINKGTEVGNRADMAFAQLQADKANQISQGIAYIPQTYAGRMYRGPGGLMYTEAEMKGIMKEQRVQENDLQKGAQTIGGQLLVAGAKENAEAEKRKQQFQVQLPSGDVITAAGPEQHKALTEAASSILETRRLVAEAKEIRNDLTWRTNPVAREKLKSIQSNLITQYGVQNKLGALSASDMDLAVSGTGDLFGLGPGPDRVLDRTNATAEKKLSAMVSTIPGASPRARGEMPKSTSYHGGEK